MRRTVRGLLYILTVAGMLALGILIKSTAAMGATEDGKKTVSVAYFYDKSYFGSKYDSVEKEGFGYEFLQALANYAGWEYRYIPLSTASSNLRFRLSQILFIT